MNSFVEWNNLKEKLHAIAHEPPLVSTREIWWSSLGKNVGSEIQGKSSLYSRPVIIFKKLSHGFYFVIPTTSKEKAGSWYVPFVYKEKRMFACLHQARTIDYRRLSSRLGQIDGDDFAKVQKLFIALYI